MNFRRTCGILLAFSFLTINAVADTATFDITSSNLTLDEDMVGFLGTVTTGTSPNQETFDVQTFCVDFANNIGVPSDNTAYITGIESTSNLSDTRFGGVTAWTQITLGTTEHRFHHQRRCCAGSLSNGGLFDDAISTAQHPVQH